VRSRGAFPFYALLRGLAYSAARAGDDEALVFDSQHEVLLSGLYEFGAPLVLNSQPLTTQLLWNHYRARSLPSKDIVTKSAVGQLEYRVI